MTQFLPPNLLALFAPRDPVPYLPPLEKLPHEKHHNQPYAGIAPFIREFEDPRDAPPPTRAETREERTERKRREKIERRQQDVENELKIWDPHNDPNALGDAFKTLFVARVNYDTTESKLRREFEVYGPIKRIHIVFNRRSGKPRGYAFIEYEHERDMHSSYKHADGKKIDGRRVLVDVERGRTVKGWRPRRLGGGLGGTRRGGADVNIRHSGRDDASRYDESVTDHSSARPIGARGAGGDRERERGERERPGIVERSRDRDKERDRRRTRSRERRRRTRSREKEEPRKRSREKSRDKDKEVKDKDKDRDRKRRSRSRERKRERGDRDKKDDRVDGEVSEAGDAPVEEVPIAELVMDGAEMKTPSEEKSRERDRERDRDKDRDKDRERDRDRDRRRSHRDRERDKDRDKDKDKEKDKDKDKDKDKEKDKDKDKDRDRDRDRRRDRDRDRDREHRRERDRGERGVEKREDLPQDNGMSTEQLEEASQDLYMEEEEEEESSSMQSGDGYLLPENGFLVEAPVE